jgi:hypothetical protein
MPTSKIDENAVARPRLRPGGPIRRSTGSIGESGAQQKRRRGQPGKLYVGAAAPCGK